MLGGFDIQIKRWWRDLWQTRQIYYYGAFYLIILIFIIIYHFRNLKISLFFHNGVTLWKRATSIKVFGVFRAKWIINSRYFEGIWIQVKLMLNPCLLFEHPSIGGRHAEVSLSSDELHNSWKVLFSGGVEKLIVAPSASSYFKARSITGEVRQTSWLLFLFSSADWMYFILQEEMFQNLFKDARSVK